MIGSLVGAGLNIAGSVLGGIAASKAMKNYKEGLQRQGAENKDWYDRYYNEDATQRADALRILTMTEESIKNRNRQAAGAAAVSGATEESVAAAKAAGNQALADAASQIAAAGAARKDAVEGQYQARKAALDAAENDLERQRAAGIAQAVQGVAGAAGGIATNLDDVFKKK